MSDEPSFPHPNRRTKPPARPPGDYSKRQDTYAKRAEELWRQARREGWSRRRFYDELTDKRYTKRNKIEQLNPAIRDNLIDRYVAPTNKKLHKRIPDGWTARSHQESMIEMINYARDLEEDGADYVIVQDDEGGYRAYVNPESP